MSAVADSPVKTSVAKALARALFVVGILGVVLEIVQALISGGDSDNGLSGTLLFILSILPQVGLLTLGWLIVTRQHANRMGWLFFALALSAELWIISGAYASEALLRRPGQLPLGPTAAWVWNWSLPLLLLMFIPLFLLFPTGRAVSPRWRWVTWTWVAVTVVSVLGWATSPKPILVGGETLGVRVYGPIRLGSWTESVTSVAGFLGFAVAIAAMASLIVRYRRAGADERQQIRWIRFVGFAFFATFVTNVAAITIVLHVVGSHAADVTGNVLFFLVAGILIIGLPAAAGVAILKYHLYDLDVVIKKTLVFGALAGFIALVYAAIVGGLGAIIGSKSNTLLSFAAAAVLAIAFQPVRAWARRFADRLVYGKRATPYEVLAEFSDRMSETYATEDVLPRMAQILAEGTGAEVARVWLSVGGELRPVATWGNGGEPPPLRISDDRVPDPPGEHAVEVRHQGELLGSLSVVMPPADPMNPAKDKLVRDLAAQAGLVLRNVRLISDLRASRQRLVAAQDEERRKLERNLHDGAQQQLVALAVKLRLAEQLSTRDVEKAKEMLSGLQTDTQDALENLRDLARGIYPPLLADKGLPTALEGQANKATIPVTVSAEGIGRYPQEVEAAIYFCCLEALQNVQKYAGAAHAEIAVSQRDGTLAFEVADDGVGFDTTAIGYGTGLQGMADRLDAIGGSLSVESSAERGTTVTGRVPLNESDLQPSAREPAGDDTASSSEEDERRAARARSA
jgi:signal transduction histidine kinase